MEETSLPERKTLKSRFIRFLLYAAGIAIAGFGVIWYISRSAQNSSAVLPKIYTSYTQALAAGKIADFSSYFSNGDLEKQLTVLTEENRANAIDVLKLSIPDHVTFGARLIEGDHAFLRFEGNVPGSTTNSPTTPHLYGTVYFIRQSNQWKIDHQTVQAYQNPIPAGLLSKQKDITPLLWTPQFHANHTGSPAQCDSEQKWRGACLSSWAVLRLDESYCGRISDATDFDESFRSSCYQTLATLLGDQSLCDHIKTPVGQAGCRKNFEDVGWFKTINIARIDSDDDGLTDLQEIYFNTSITNPDTDDDGVPDGEEIEKGSNPLGEGNVGDHLSRFFKPTPAPDVLNDPNVQP